VDQIVVGYPVNPEGHENPIVKQILLFTDNLKKIFPDIPLDFYDEQYTSRDAYSAMLAAGIKKKKRQEKGNTDKLAAALILQGWMEERGMY
jgi:putative Holliday junction resolvase